MVEVVRPGLREGKRARANRVPLAKGGLFPSRLGAAYSCNCRFSDSTSSDNAVSLATSASILRTA
jgi:hypothetical protein